MEIIEKQTQESDSKTIETLPDGTTVEKEIIRIKNLNGTEVALEKTLKTKGEEYLEETIRDVASGKILVYTNFEELLQISSGETFLEKVFGVPQREDQKSAIAFLPKQFMKKTIDKIRGN
ncbi:hypothetical protein A2567_01380 [Candidatus Azambacteria bacterium RIFOXYD1_FULL_42_11]|uniref:Uncharacterized protein n=3 Tax=Candidatus Azamiibacteriota TaxID=1752741 RepID=A0A0G0ZAE0_9BACT|nr:MAG: hypothetical protein UV10_C0017G0021 [Candidatus Azambacteria bacterium GW2011_GWA1_42_19]KKS75447.1 MAG: hypothetical protein UV48_C0012G0019 [Candidatus Azambacteria bacterium GW2011_GWA2_42_9]KKS88097.1 MAG: hypothetical protein UV62_C0015G0018 [Parcubacteria group bacterium GW2011_GWC1_43_11]OGD42303.1 MAG: hypothetical protein A2567_01380 [Candidatus Azambacteria bacterium RIFOXYD1_FULL_42_11]